MPSIPSQVSWKQLRDLLGAVAIKELPKGSPERKVAGQASDGSGDSVLRGKDELKAAATLLAKLNGQPDDADVQLRDEAGNLTEAGKIVSAWSNARVDRADLFDGVGSDGKPAILRINIDKLDLSNLWKNDADGAPKKVKAGPSTRLTVFEVAPHLSHAKMPSEANGIALFAQGEDAVSIKRRGNMSIHDAKPQLSIQINDDSASGVPDKIQLVNMIRDPSYQRIHMAWHFMEKARVPSQPRTFAELNINNQHYGTYVAMPPMDRAHFDERFPPAKKEKPAAIFKANWKDKGAATLRYIAPKPGETNGAQYFKAKDPENRTYESREDTPDADYHYLASFIETLNAVELRGENGAKIEGESRFNTVAYRESMEKAMDVYSFLRVAVMQNLMGSWDTYYKTPANYFLHVRKVADTDAPEGPDGKVRGYVTFHPYDLDNTFGTSWPGQARNWQSKSIFYKDPEVGDVRLIEVLLRNEQLKSYYVDFMAWMVNTHFKETTVESMSNKMWNDVLSKSVYLESDTEHGPAHTQRPWTNRSIHEAADLGWETWGFNGQYKAEGLEHFVRMRRESVQKQLSEVSVGKSGVDFNGKDWTPNWGQS